jgi:hypothetical protein
MRSFPYELTDIIYLFIYPEQYKKQLKFQG